MNKLMKILLLTSLFLSFFSCTKNDLKEKDLIKSHLIKILDLDDAIWEISKLNLSRPERIEIVADYKDCVEYKIEYDIVLLENCYENPSFKSSLENNLIIKKVKEIFSFKLLEGEIFQKNKCLSEKWIKNIYMKEKEKIKSKIGNRYCVETKSLLNRDCLRYEIYSEDSYKKEKKLLAKKFLIETSSMKKYDKGTSFKKEDFLIMCNDDSGIIFP